MCIMIFKLHVVCGTVQSKRLKKSNRTVCQYCQIIVHWLEHDMGYAFNPKSYIRLLFIIHLKSWHDTDTIHANPKTRPVWEFFLSFITVQYYWLRYKCKFKPATTSGFPVFDWYDRGTFLLTQRSWALLPSVRSQMYVFMLSKKFSTWERWGCSEVNQFGIGLHLFAMPLTCIS